MSLVWFIRGKMRLLINLLNPNFPNIHIFSPWFRTYQPFSIIRKLNFLWNSGKVYCWLIWWLVVKKINNLPPNLFISRYLCHFQKLRYCNHWDPRRGRWLDGGLSPCKSTKERIILKKSRKKTIPIDVYVNFNQWNVFFSDDLIRIKNRMRSFPCEGDKNLNRLFRGGDKTFLHLFLN